MAKPGTAGISMLSAVTAVPSAIRGTRLGGGAVPLVTHSSSAANNARRAGVALCGVRVGAGAVLRAGNQVDPDIRWQIGVIAAGRIGVHQRSALLPVLGRAVGLDDQRVGRPARRMAPVLRENGSVATALPNGNQFSG